MSAPVRLWASSVMIRGKQRHAQQMQFMGDAIDGHRFKSRIAENNLVVGLGRRVAIHRRLDVQRQHFAQRRQPAQKSKRIAFALFQVIGTRPLALVIVGARQVDLLGQILMHFLQDAADEVAGMRRVDLALKPVIREKNVLHIGQDAQRNLPVGQDAFAQMIQDHLPAVITGADFLDDAAQVPGVIRASDLGPCSLTFPSQSRRMERIWISGKIR